MLDDKESNESSNKDIEASSENSETSNIHDENKIEELESKVKQLEDQLIRTVADLHNYQKRAEKEKTDIAKFAITKFAKDILSIFDNLQLALSNCSNNEDPIVSGVKMTLNQMDKVFSSYDIKMINSQNAKFDPNYHQAMNEIESDLEPGTIVKVMQEGFTIKDRLLRPALVTVAKNINK